MLKCESKKGKSTIKKAPSIEGMGKPQNNICDGG
jgi:hypothetical protein